MKKLTVLISLLIFTFLLTACGTTASGDPAAAIEAYLTALVEKDLDGMVSHACAAWESTAQVENQAYYGVEARLEGLACTVTGSEGEATVVSCEGNIIATYSGEDTPLPLNVRQYLSVEEGGEWRMCGYK